jgi:hypothetical protein
MNATTAEEVKKMEKVPYKSILGQLIHIAITARPDIAFAVSNCGRFASNPGPTHWYAILMILRYLQGFVFTKALNHITFNKHIQNLGLGA